jgi:hypothetical protein
VRLRASARIQGHGDEPRRPYGVLSPACRTARSIRRIRLTAGPASKNRSLNSNMAVPLPNKVVSGRKFNEWVRGMVQLWIIFDHCEEPWGTFFTASPAQSCNIR